VQSLRLAKVILFSFRQHLFSLLLALALPLVSCDSGGSNGGGSSPGWVGTWELLSVEDGEVPDEAYYSFSEEEIRFVASEEAVPNCFSDALVMTDVGRE
jgi:hypothetical protein